MLSEKDCRAIVENLLGYSRADALRIRITGGDTAHLRFARNTPSTSGLLDTRTLTVTSTFGTRTGSASVNQLEGPMLEAVVRRSEELAKRAPEDPEYLPPLEQESYLPVGAYFEEREEDRIASLAEGARSCIRAAQGRELVAAGFARSDVSFTCLANSAGLFGYHRSTDATFSETVRTPDGSGSGWGAAAAKRAQVLDFTGSSRVAIQKAVRSRQPRRLEPGRYPVLLEPACVASLLGLLVRAMDARSADEGRSYFSAPEGGTRIGERMFPEFVNVYSDPQDRIVGSIPWGTEGLAHERTDWIRAGRIENFSTSRYWARETGRNPLPRPANLIFSGGKRSLDQLLADMQEGLLVTRLWYIRSVDPKTLLYTGLTRDGVFWVEKGRIAYPVNNFRWNDSPISVLKNALAASTPARVPTRGRRTLAPGLLTSEFTFSSVSEAV